MDLGGWGSIAGIVIGALLAAGGGWLAQWSADRRAVEREKRERVEDRLDDRATWARGHQLDAHLKFLTDFDAMVSMVSRRQEDMEEDPSINDPPNDLLLPLWNRMTFVRMVSDRATVDATEAAMQALHRFVFRGAAEAEVDLHRDDYLAAIRREFGLGEIETTREQLDSTQPAPGG